MNIIITLYIVSLLFPVIAYSEDGIFTSIAHDARGVAHALPTESADLATVPFQVKNNNVLVTLGVIGATSLTYIFDKDIQSKLQSNRSRGMDRATDAGTLIGDPFIHLGLAALVYGTATIVGSSEWKETGIKIGEALILADASTFMLKQAVGRGRPERTSDKGNFKPFGFKSDYDSFPSMHTASSFALASVLSANEKNYIIKSGYYLTAGFVAFSRIYKNKHWASDVLFGAALGELSGRIVTNYHSSERKITVAPQLYDNGAGLVLVGTW